MNKIVKLERKQGDVSNSLTWYIEATYANGDKHPYQTLLTERGSKAWLTRVSKMFGLKKMDENLAELEDSK